MNGYYPPTLPLYFPLFHDQPPPPERWVLKWVLALRKDYEQEVHLIQNFITALEHNLDQTIETVFHESGIFNNDINDRKITNLPLHDNDSNWLIEVVERRIAQRRETVSELEGTEFTRGGRERIGGGDAAGDYEVPKTVRRVVQDIQNGIRRLTIGLWKLKSPMIPGQLSPLTRPLGTALN